VLLLLIVALLPPALIPNCVTAVDCSTLKLVRSSATVLFIVVIRVFVLVLLLWRFVMFTRASCKLLFVVVTRVSTALILALRYVSFCWRGTGSKLPLDTEQLSIPPKLPIVVHEPRPVMLILPFASIMRRRVMFEPLGFVQKERFPKPLLPARV
jgi:hypothetical protein